MDLERIEYFASNYRRLADEEIAHLFVTRRDHLIEEAQHALDAELKQRNPTGFARELAATQQDLEAQARHEAEQSERQARTSRLVRKGIHGLSGFLIILGVSFVVAGNADSGWTLAGIGAGLSVMHEVRRLIGRAVGAMFRMS